MSLLQDARRDVAPDLAAAAAERYFSLVPGRDRRAFETHYQVLAAQRHCKVAGIFVRLWVRDGKPGYIRHLPRVLRLLRAALACRDLDPVRAWFDATVALPSGPMSLPDRAAVGRLCPVV